MIEPLSLQALPPEAEALRGEVRRFLDGALAGMPPELRARSWLGFDAGFSRALGARGWIGLGLPTAYGGGGRDAFARFVLVEELLARGAPVSAHWIAERQSAPMILRYGTEAQKQRYVPGVCRGETFFCIGMSEPQSGSDLASIRTRATPTASGWRLSGQKIWTTNADHSQHMIALVRTSGTTEDRQKGLSQLVVDLATPGITVRPIEDLTGDRHFSEVFFDDVELPHDALVGEEGSGWQQVTAELAYERSGPERLYSSIVLFDTWLEHLRRVGADDDASLALAGRIVGHTATLRSMSLAVTAKVAAGQSPMTEASLVKDLGTELEQFMPLAIADALASAPQHDAPPALLRTLAYVTQFSPTFSLRGGTREILRGLIARGLGAAMNDLWLAPFERLLEDACTPAVVRAIEGGGSPAALWARIDESGFLDALVPEAAGGAGLRLADAFGLFVAEGRHALPVPVAHTMLVRAALAHEGLAAPVGMLAIAPLARVAADGAIGCPNTPYGLLADWVAVAQAGSWLLLPAAQAQREASGIHGSLRASLRWPAGPADAIAASEAVAWDEAGAAASAAQLAGAMARALEMTVRFADERVQFGRPIGRFQAIQHQLAVMAEHVSAGRMAAEIGCTGPGPLPGGLRAALAKARASEAAACAASIAHAVHGAIGVTAEFDLQIFTRRLHEWRADFGSEQHWNRVLGRALLAHSTGDTLDFMRAALIPSNEEIRA